MLRGDGPFCQMRNKFKPAKTMITTTKLLDVWKKKLWKKHFVCGSQPQPSRFFVLKGEPTKTGPKSQNHHIQNPTTLSDSDVPDVRPRNGVPPFKKFPACKATPKRCLCKGKCRRRCGWVGDGWDGEQALVVGKWYLFCCDLFQKKTVAKMVWS